MLRALFRADIVDACNDSLFRVRRHEAVQRYIAGDLFAGLFPENQFVAKRLAFLQGAIGTLAEVVPALVAGINDACGGSDKLVTDKTDNVRHLLIAVDDFPVTDEQDADRGGIEDEALLPVQLLDIRPRFQGQQQGAAELRISREQAEGENCAHEREYVAADPEKFPNLRHQHRDDKAQERPLAGAEDACGPHRHAADNEHHEDAVRHRQRHNQDQRRPHDAHQPGAGSEEILPARRFGSGRGRAAEENVKRAARAAHQRGGGKPDQQGNVVCLLPKGQRRQPRNGNRDRHRARDEAIEETKPFSFGRTGSG